MIRMKHKYNLSGILLVIILSFEKPRNTGAIVGQGTRVKKVKPNEFPFVVSLAYDDNEVNRVTNQYCTGTLVSPQSILTSKRCAVALTPRPTVIYAGSFSLRKCKKYHWSERYFYEDWAVRNNRPIDSGYDEIAIVKLQDKIEDIQPAVLDASWSNVKIKTALRMLGWGTVGQGHSGMKADELRAAWVRIWPDDGCLEKSELSTVEQDLKRNVCTKTMCTRFSGYALLASGDHGGPLINKNNRVVGVNIDVVPKDEPYQNQFNLHGTIFFYRDFIFAAVSDSYTVSLEEEEEREEEVHE